MKRIIMLGAIASIIVLLSMLFVFPSSASSHSAGYAVWVDEDDFLAKPEKPNAYYNTNKLSTENLEGKGYVLCYGDIEVTENVQLARGQNLTIDLGGYKLTASSKIVVNGSASTSWSSSGALTIKNGTIDHIKNQFIQLRTNAEVYFDNITVNEMSEAPNMAVRSGHAFVTDSGGRIISFNNCNITISSSAKLNMFSLSTPFDGISADQAYKDENNKNTDYVRNLIFSNTVFYDKSIKVDDEYNTNIVYVNYADSNIDILNISFTGGSAINLLRDNLFKKEKVSDKSIYNVNISKGCKFTSPSIDFKELDVSYILYDYIEREGNRVNLGNVTELAEYDYENNFDTENTKLIWGNTDSIDFPYMLCYYLCDITWVNGDDVCTERGYGDGLVLQRHASGRGYYFGVDQRIYLDEHIGWSYEENGGAYTEFVELSSPSTIVYAGFESNVLSVVEFSDESLDLDGILSGISGNNITERDFAHFKNGSYIRFYDDMIYSSNTSVDVSSNITLDLAGYSMYQGVGDSYESGSLNVTGGAKLEIINGTIHASMTSIAVITNGTLEICDVVLTFDSSPAFYIHSGEVNMKNVNISQRVVCLDTPFVIVAPLDDECAFDMDSCHVDIEGAMISYNESYGITSTPNISIINSTISSQSVIMVTEKAANGISKDSSLHISINGSDIYSDIVFDISSSDDGYGAIYGIYEIESSSFSTKPDTSFGEIITPDGSAIVFCDSGELPYTVAEVPFKLKYSMNVDFNFASNIYISRFGEINHIKTYCNIYNSSDLDVVTLDNEEYYIINVDGISASDCFDPVVIEVSYKIHGLNYLVTVEYEPSDYLIELLYSEDLFVRRISASAIRYIVAAYHYAGSVIPAKVESICSGNEYLSLLRNADDVPVMNSTGDYGNINEAFSSMQLYLSSSVYLRLNIADGFSGTLNISGVDYIVTNGRENGRKYILIPFSAKEIYQRKVKISGSSTDDDVIIGACSIIDYIDSLKDSNSYLGEMLDSLYYYSYEAYVYTSGGDIPPYSEHTPPLDIEIRY